MKRRFGLNPPFSRERLDAIAQAERVAAAILRGERRFRRVGDPPGTVRVVYPEHAGISAAYGLTISVTGHVNGIADPGLTCRDCPLCDLEPLEDP